MGSLYEQDKNFYESHIVLLLDDNLKDFVSKVTQIDRTYIPQNHKEEWSATILRVCTLIKRIVYEIYKANPNYVHFFNFGPNSGPDLDTINDLINTIKYKLETKFHTSPPFTILHFVETMMFLSGSIDVPLIPDITFEYNGLKKYKRKVNDLVLAETTEVEVTNISYEEPEQCKESYPFKIDLPVLSSTNDINAAKYLLALISIISVESSIDDVKNDLINYESNNIIKGGSKGEEKVYEEDDFDDTTSDQSSTSSIKMVKIPWYEPNMLTSITDTQNDTIETNTDNNN